MSQELYHPLILEHNQKPAHFGKMDDPDFEISCINPLCGDSFTIYFKLEGESIQEVKFHGYGCAVSKASASALMLALEGKTWKEIPDIIQQFIQVVTETGEPSNKLLQALANVRQFPERMECVRLVWDELEQQWDSASLGPTK